MYPVNWKPLLEFLPLPVEGIGHRTQLHRMKEQLTRAEGFFLLRMLSDAWEVTEEMAPIDRIEPLVLELRLRILTESGRWELGGHLAGVLIASAIKPKMCRELDRRHTRKLAPVGTICGPEPTGRTQKMS